MNTSVRRWVLGVLLLIAVVGLGVPFIALLNEGKIQLPESSVIQHYFSGGISVAAFIAVGLIVLLAACAPIVFAARSGDAITILISLVLVTLTWASVFQSRTVVDMVMAAVIYLASLSLSAVVFASARIVEALTAQRRA